MRGGPFPPEVRVKLSILELGTVSPGTTETQGLADALATARAADALGFERIWFAEHHLTPLAASHHPELLIAPGGKLPTTSW